MNRYLLEKENKYELLCNQAFVESLQWKPPQIYLWTFLYSFFDKKKQQIWFGNKTFHCDLIQ